jgi:DNA-binding transcriptional ArsR family regulator
VIDYRRWSMDITRREAATWATWFRALGDPSRILILNLLAAAAEPLSVGEIVAELDLAQSTVSHHLKILADVRFVLVERDGASSQWRVNERCLACFPSAAEVVMGRLPGDVAPWDAPVRTNKRRSQ